MVFNKDRLYVGLYIRGGGSARMPAKEDTYHWALLIGPKKEKTSARGKRFQAKNIQTGPNSQLWLYDELESSLTATGQLLIRILVAKVTDRERLITILRSVPVVQDDPDFNCVVWVKEALSSVQKDGLCLGTSDLDWGKVRDTALTYLQQKKDGHRFDGKVNFDMSRPATYDLLEQKETIP